MYFIQYGDDDDDDDDGGHRISKPINANTLCAFRTVALNYK